MLSSGKPIIKDIHYNEFTSEICGSWYNYKFVSIYNAGVSFVYVSTDKLKTCAPGCLSAGGRHELDGGGR